MLTVASLRSYTHKDLAQMAKRRGVAKWHSMRKDELVRALVKSAKSEAAKSNGSRNGTKATAKPSKATAKPSKATATAKAKSPAKSRSKSRSNGSAAGSKANPKPNRRIKKAQKEREQRMDLAGPQNGKTKQTGPGANAPARDRIVLMVRDPYWLHAHWELTRACVDRARAALAQMWHTAKPVLRIYEVDAGTTTNTMERVSRDVEIHGGVQNWYIDVADPPNSYAVEIGYLAADGRFHRVARSNVVTTPRPGASAGTDDNWADVAEDCQRIYALSGGYASENDTGELQELFEERFKRPMGTPMTTRYGVGAQRYLGHENGFDLQVDAEMIIHGQTKPNAHVMLGGEPVQVQPDGSFSVRMEMGNQRQVIPVVAESLDGMQQRTIVVGVERNTKVMELVTRDPNEV